ncbi:MAG: hypothetical protein R3325_14005 [Thermoanaerobaculia bacterium]|nr:hypothetical protein [Thermoanaerobaculia bacterium]
MARALLLLGWLATAGLVATAAVGYLVDGSRYFDLHLLTGLGAALLLLFSHCWIMFFLIGTGKAIREAVAEHALDPELVERTKELKNACYPALMLAMGLAMTAFIVGGGVATQVIPAWVHQALFFLALLAQVRALLKEHGALGRNAELMAEVDRRLAAADGGAPAAGL